MEYVHEFLKEFRWGHDKSNYVERFSKDPKDLDNLVQVVVELQEYPYKEYASYLMTHMVKSKKIDFQPYYNQLVDVLFKTKDQTVLRNVTNVINHSKITDYRESDFIDLLIGFVQDPKNKVALHVYSIYVLVQFVKKYPELKGEIEQIIALNAEGKTAAYRIATRNFHSWTK
jgi:hypothetical protein